LLNNTFSNIKDVQKDVFYILKHLNSENSSPIVFYKLSCKAMKFNKDNSIKWMFASLKLKFGMFNWDCIRVQFNCLWPKMPIILYIMWFFGIIEWTMCVYIGPYCIFKLDKFGEPIWSMKKVIKSQ